MTNNVDTTPISTKRARLQFTIMELLLFVALTFLGMAVVVPRIEHPPKEIVCALVLVATALGAALGLARSTPNSPRRKLWLVLGVCFGGLLTAWATCVAMILADGIPLAAVTFAMIGLPVAIAL